MDVLVSGHDVVAGQDTPILTVLVPWPSETLSTPTSPDTGASVILTSPHTALELHNLALAVISPFDMDR